MMKNIKNWTNTLIASSFFFYSFLQMMLCNMLGGHIEKTLQITPIQLGTLGSAFLIGNLLSTIPAGIILDKYNTKKVLLITFFLSIISSVAFTYTTSYGLALFLRLLAGGMHAFTFLTSATIVTQNFSEREQAVPMSITLALGILGGVLAQGALSELASQLGWQQALQTIALLALIPWGGILFLLQNKKEEKKGATTFTKQIIESIKQLTQIEYNTWLYALHAAIINLPIMLFGAHIGVPFLYHLHHIAYPGPICTLLMIGLMIGSPIMGTISNLLQNRKQITLISTVLTTLLTTTTILIHPQTEWLLKVTFFLIGFFSSAQVINFTAVAESAPPHIISISMSALSLTLMGLGALIPMAITQFIGGSSSPDIYRYTTLPIAILLLISSFIRLKLPETFKEKNK